MKKMKRFLIVMLFALILSSCGGESGTKHVKVTFETNGGEMSAEVMQAECGKTLELPANPTKAGYEFAGWFLDAELENPFDPEKVVEEGFTLYAKWETKDVTIYVTSVKINSGFLAYETNKSSEGKDEKMQFLDDEVAYMVGDDNGWSAKPEVVFSFINEFGVFERISVEEWEYEVVVSLKTEEGYEDVATLSEKYLDGEIDTKNVVLDFAEAAIGKTFEVKVTPTGLTEKQLAEIAIYQTKFEIEVVDGFNVYNELELGYIENRATGVQADAWKEFKGKNGLDVNYQPNALILHKNLNISTEHVPTYFFYQASELSSLDPDYEQALGSAKDEEDIFTREFVGNEQFAIYGNYFNVDFSNLREIVREWGEIDTDGLIDSHALLIRFRGAATGKAKLSNVSLVGNAARVDDPKKSGGHIFIKATGPEFEAYNAITSCFYIPYFPDGTDAPFTITKCRAYDSFSCFVFNWGSPKVKIDSCIMKGAGGPVVIQNHVNPNTENSRVGSTEILNSNLESYVAGTEGWFIVVNATSAAANIKALDGWFTAVGNRSFLKKGASGEYYFNFVVCNKSGSVESATAEKVEGTIKIDDCVYDYGATNPIIAAMVNTAFNYGSPSFQTSAGGYGFFNQNPAVFEGLYLSDLNGNPILNPTDLMYQGDYLTLYFNGMALVLGYGPAGETL